MIEFFGARKIAPLAAAGCVLGAIVAPALAQDTGYRVGGDKPAVNLNILRPADGQAPKDGSSHIKIREWETSAGVVSSGKRGMTPASLAAQLRTLSQSMITVPIHDYPFAAGRAQRR